MWATEQDWRVPDLAVFPESSRSGRGVDGPAELVVEIRSPNDETDAKLPWYVAHRVAEILVIDPPTRTATLYRNGDDGLPELVGDTTHAGLELRIGVGFRTVVGDDGPGLHASAGGETTIL